MVQAGVTETEGQLITFATAQQRLREMQAKTGRTMTALTYARADSFAGAVPQAGPFARHLRIHTLLLGDIIFSQIVNGIKPAKIIKHTFNFAIAR